MNDPNAIAHAVEKLFDFIESTERVFPLDTAGRARRYAVERLWMRQWLVDNGLSASAAAARLAAEASSKATGRRLRAVRSLGLLAADAPLPVIVRTLGDAEPLLRLCAAEVLGFLGRADGIVVRALRRALRDENARVRREAALSLSALEPTAGDVLPHLLLAVGNGQDDERERVAVALGDMGAAAGAAVPALLEALAQERSGALKAVLRRSCLRIGGVWIQPTVYGM